MKDTIFFKQAELLLKILPIIFKEKIFALKGGTAINFFIRDLPRLSVDVDLTYLPINERNLALSDITSALIRISENIKRLIPKTKIFPKKLHGTEYLRGIIVNQEGVTVKIEPNLIIRGSVYPPKTWSLSKKAQDIFELSVQCQILSPDELYAGKICAALDRQHPRDLFDIWLLMKNEGLTPQLRKIFIVYLISHSRPMIEILNPKPKDIRDTFEKEFKSMIAEQVSYEELEETREKIVSWLKSDLTMDEREFILSIKEGNPKWDLLPFEGIEKLPAVKWKLLNIKRMDSIKRKIAIHNLRNYLEI